MSSKLDKSMIVAGAGLVASIFTTFVKKVREKGGTDEDIHRLATPDGEAVLEKIADIIVSSKHQVFKVMVDYAKTLEEMIKDGQYDWVNHDIASDHFLVTGTGQKETEITFFHFNRVISSDNAIVEMAKAGYLPALVEELLTLGAAYKELQKQFPIVALGSVWQYPDGDRYVPCLPWDGRERRLDLHWFEDGWRERWRFAAVRNAS
ncbi:MAG: hypothetical protein Q8N58_02775 [bacterium]|nr:hypothetical protein [bacterium]